MGRTTEREIHAVYAYGLKVIQGDITQTGACARLEIDYGFNPNSAIDYITALKKMLRGEVYKRAINQLATRIFFEKIRNDFGDAGLRKAISATRAHVNYYATHGRGRLVAIAGLCDEYEAKFLRG